jgi:1-deoxy-D-xylulose-5-phosphate reductoisomerase
VIHPASLVHSLVTFRDGAVLAQLGAPDMRVPLLYALSGEKHWPLATERLNLIEVANLAFAAPDTARFPCLALARRAGETGGVAPVVLNAANEVAVASLLQGRLRFVELPVVIEKSLEAVPAGSLGNLEEALAVDREARRVAAGFIP